MKQSCVFFSITCVHSVKFSIVTQFLLVNPAPVDLPLVCTSGRFVKQEQWEGGVWAQAPGTPPPAVQVRGYHPQKEIDIVYAKSCNIVHFWPENGSQCRP